MSSFENIPDDCIFEIPHRNKMVAAKILNVYDGDTSTVLIELKNGVYMKIKIRVAGIDTPELCPSLSKSNCELEKQAALAIKDKVKKLIEGKIVKVVIKDFDKYGGRYIGEIYLSCADKPRKTLTNYLLKNKFGKIYNGEKKEDWSSEELTFIIDFCKKKSKKDTSDCITGSV